MGDRFDFHQSSHDSAFAAAKENLLKQISGRDERGGSSANLQSASTDAGRLGKGAAIQPGFVDPAFVVLGDDFGHAKNPVIKPQSMDLRPEVKASSGASGSSSANNDTKTLPVLPIWNSQHDLEIKPWMRESKKQMLIIEQALRRGVSTTDQLELTEAIHRLNEDAYKKSHVDSTQNSKWSELLNSSGKGSAPASRQAR